jgi:acrylyl-CoA reductase (NADPH)
MSIRALIVEKADADASPTARVGEIAEADLPEGDVTVAVEYSTLNYKDGLCIGSGGGLVKSYPHVPGIDFAGTVESSRDERYAPGDKVILTGWRVGETWWGGYAEKARVKADWLVPLPDPLTTRQAMAVGTAGLTAMLAVMALEANGLKPGPRPVLVTGAAGGVGSVAVSILSHLGHSVAAVTGRPETADYLAGLGADRIVPRAELADPPSRPLESETWAGAVDSVAGDMLARVIGQIAYGGAVAAVGLAGGAGYPGSVIPLILRSVSVLGIDSVMAPYDRRVAAWRRIVDAYPLDRLEATVVEAALEDLPRLGAEILAGQVRGRVVVDLTR